MCRRTWGGKSAVRPSSLWWGALRDPSNCASTTVISPEQHALRYSSFGQNQDLTGISKGARMQGTMMNYPLTLVHLLERAGKIFPESEVVSRVPNRSLHRYTYADLYRRARALAAALQKAGVRRGDRVATLMWNHYVHVEAYFAIPSCGGVTHPLNLRLAPADIAYIANHAGDRFLIVDDVLLPLYERIKDSVNFERVIVVAL